MTNKLWFRKLLPAVFLVVIIFLAFSSFYVPTAQALDDFADTIFFEYGAESGVLQPPWDDIGTHPQDLEDYDYTIVDDTHARTGTKSMKLYQPPPTKTDSQSRVSNRMYRMENSSVFPDESYISWWVYYPSSVWSGAGIGSTQGGHQTFFGPSDWRSKWWTSTRFRVHSDGYVQATYKWGESEAGNPPPYNEDADDLSETWTGFPNGTKFYVTDHLDEWVHYQIYTKWSTSANGATTAWINGNLFFTKTGMITDPRGYPEWDTKAGSWAHNSKGLSFVIELYQHETSLESWTWVDDVVASLEKVTETYGVGYQSLEFESWEDGFESGDFSAWNDTEVSNPSNAWTTITSTYSYTGAYSANFTSDGTPQSYARAIHVVQNVTEVYQRSYVAFEDLPDSNDTEIDVLRIGQTDDTWIASVGVWNASGNVYWIVEVTGFSANYTSDTILADTWYSMEFYFNATSNGNATLWVNDVLKCQITGDFSGVGNIASVYPYILVDGAQTSAKTVSHDNFRVDTERIYARPSRASIIDVTAEPSIVSKDGATSQITVQLKDTNNQTVAQLGAPIHIEISNWTGPSKMKPSLFYAGQMGNFVTVTTDSNGQATLTIIARGAKGYVTIMASGDGLSSGDTMVHVTN